MNVSETVSIAQATAPVEISVIIPVIDRFDEPGMVWDAYAGMLESTGQSFEFIYVLDGPQPAFAPLFERLSSGPRHFQALHLNRSFGEAACLHEGIRRAKGDLLLILPAYLQIAPESIASLVERAEHVDVVTAARDRREDKSVNRLRGWGFKMAARFAGSRFDDPGCAVRAVRRHVFDEVQMQDDQHRFLPLLAERLGFKVEQVHLPQAAADRRFRAHHATTYVSRLLDIIALGFLVSFIQKPFRFFGTVGAVSVIVGVLIGIYMVIERQFGGVPIADRPMLLLMALLIVLGIQIAAVGLIAEIVIFTRHRGNPAYRIEKIVEHGGDVGHGPI